MPEGSAGRARLSTGIAVIGAGQAGLSAAYHLQRLDHEPVKDFVVLDANPEAGGAWQHRWPSLTLSTVNRLHDLPGLPFSEAVSGISGHVRANEAVPRYFRAYEEKFGLPVFRPVQVSSVREERGRFLLTSGRGEIAARGIINATGSWETPHLPHYPGVERFRGQQLHTKDYVTAEVFRGRHVIIVGGGISTVQLLDEVSRVTTVTWVTRRPPDFREGPFDETAGRRAVAIVEERVRNGLEPESVVSLTGLPVTPQIVALRERGGLERLPMFEEILGDGVRWADGSTVRADVILWNTGFRGSLDHLEPLGLRGAGGGIRLTGRLATQVAHDPRIHLVGYGPSASTIGANRAGGAAARELTDHLRSRGPGLAITPPADARAGTASS